MDKIPESIKNRIKKIEQLIIQKKIKIKRKIAVFDLDNTLLNGDIGEAVFASLKNEEQNGHLTIAKKKIPFTWLEYQKLLEKNEKIKAYKKLVTAMSGIPLKTLNRTTKKILNSTKKCLQLEGKQIPIPVANKIMLSIITLLKTLNYESYIISASNHYSVQIVAKEIFSIPESNVFGIKSKLNHQKRGDPKQNMKVLSARLEKPLSVERGKAEVFQKFIGNIPPLITAGNSETDIFMLNLTNYNGLSIWVGNDKAEYEFMKKKLKHPQTLLFLNRSPF